MLEKWKSSTETSLNLAILSSFTARGIENILSIKCIESGIALNTHICGYNQYTQEIFDSQSALYGSKPQVIIFFLDTRALLGDCYFLPYRISDEDRKHWVDHKTKELVLLVEAIKKYSKARILLHNFEVPLYSPFGILENKQPFGFKESIEALNGNLRNAFKKDAQVFLFDFDAFCARIGKQYVLDYKLYYLGDIKLHTRYIPKLCTEYVGYIKAMFGLAKKCIVLDLDNTLWGGVLGEDGIEKIKLGPTPEGRPFLEFQKYLLGLLLRGVILAVNSKNNLEEVLRVFREHPYMVLKEEHFAAMRVNWHDKVANMRSLSQELNLGIDSFVFIDDDRLNCETVRGILPEVAVVELPEDPALYTETLMDLDCFHTLEITQEDLMRGKMYAQENKRKAFEQIATDITEYLRGLQMVVTVEKASDMTIPRIAQLTQKTNQFNMTTRRYTEEVVAQYAKNDRFLVVSLHVKDKFGDSGIVGVAIVEKGSEAWRIDTFLLSCRVIGRRIEEVLLGYFLQQAEKAGAQRILGEFLETRKNAPAKEFYKKNGFRCITLEEERGKETWEYEIKQERYNFPDFIRVILPND